MQKKVFLQRNLRKGGGGGPPYMRYLLISAICLVLLVLIGPYLFKGKNKEVTKRPVPDRGTITKEVPRTPEPSVPENITEQVKPEPAVGPEAVKTPEVQSPPKPPELPPATPQQVASPEPPPAGNASAPENAPPAPAPARTAKPAEPAPKDLFPKKSSPSEAPPAAVHKAPPAAVHNVPGMPVSKAAGQTPAAKPAPSTAKGDYAVRVGVAYKNKSEAETVRKDLARKGYSAIVRTAPGGYSVITSPIPERKAYTLQEQMRIQGVSNTSVIKVTPVSGPVKKLPPGKPANGKNGISPDPGN
jgi:hypothetical protein